MGSIWAPRETRAAGRHALSRRARGVHPAATSICAPHLVTRQARGSPAAPGQPCFWSARPGTSTTTRTRECRRSSAAVRRSARSFYSILLSAAHDKAQSHAAPLHALTSRLRGSTCAVLQRGLCEHRVSRPTFRKSRRLSVRLLLRRHRSAHCQPIQPAPRPGVALGAGFGAPRGRFTCPPSSRRCDENLAMKDVRRTALASHGHDSNRGKLALKHGRRHTIAVAVSSGQQPGVISSLRACRSESSCSKQADATRAWARCHPGD